MRGTKNRRLVILLAALLAVGALPLPARAATSPSALPTYSACPTGYIPSGGFGDVKSGNVHLDDIACVKYYGITKGTTSTTYSPTAPVTREQMALFLIRTAGPSGVAVPTNPADAGFKDTAGLSPESRLAINQLFALGITKGASPTTYNPFGTVTREQMALFLARLLDKATLGPGGLQPKLISPTSHDFSDLGSVSVESYLAIVDLFHLGITTGISEGKFGPSGVVTREQMASFIARTLSHTNARPKGLSIQASVKAGAGPLLPVLAVSYRDSAFKPQPNVPVDVFEYVAATGTAPFNSNGTCKDVVAAAGSTSPCVVGISDPATNAQGNVLLNESVAAGANLTYYAWTAALGATFDRDVHTYVSVNVVSSKTATAMAVTSTLDGAATKNRTGSDTGYRIGTYGSPVNITAQLTDGVNPVATSGVEITFQHQRLDAAGGLVFIQTTVVKTGVGGAALLTITASDPTAGDDVTWDTVTVSRTGLAGSPATVKVAWEDDVAVATTVQLSQQKSYTTASSSNKGAKHTVTATVRDQFGRPLQGAGVTFVSDDPDGIGTTPLTRYTLSDGKVSLEYFRDSAATGVEVITAAISGSSSVVTHYWVLAAGSGTYQNAGNALFRILHRDVANNRVVAEWDADITTGPASTILTFTWKGGDQFNAPGPVAESVFETALGSKTLPITTLAVSYSTSGSSVWTLS